MRVKVIDIFLLKNKRKQVRMKNENNLHNKKNILINIFILYYV